MDLQTTRLRLCTVLRDKHERIIRSDDQVQRILEEERLHVALVWNSVRAARDTLRNHHVATDCAGELLGFLSGIRPAILFEPEIEIIDPTGLLWIAESCGINALLVGRLFINRPVAWGRVFHETQINTAKDVGWIYECDPVENYRRAWQWGGIDDAAGERLTGFILGIPASALDHFARWRRLSSYQPDSPLVGLLPDAKWSAQDRKTYHEIVAPLNSPIPTDLSVRGQVKWVQSYLAAAFAKADTRRLYRTYTAYTEDDVDFISELRDCWIIGPRGHIIQHFTVFGEQGLRAPDVVQRRLVFYDWFEHHGFNRNP